MVQSSTEPVNESQTFRELVRLLRGVNHEGDAFFKEFLEFCSDYESYLRAGLPNSRVYWLYRIGRMLTHFGTNPFPSLTFTHPDGKPGSWQVPITGPT